MSDDPKKPDEPEGDDEARIRAMVRGAMKGSAKKPAATEGTPAPEADEIAPSADSVDAADEDAPSSESPTSGDPDVLVDDVDLKEALRGALQPPPGSIAPNLLSGVQRRLRVRSRGKFYGDGWSTAESPKTTYLVTSIVMLLLIAVVFLILVPWSSAKLP